MFSGEPRSTERAHTGCIAGYGPYGQASEILLQQQAKALTSHKPDKTTHIATEGVLAPALEGFGKSESGDKPFNTYGKELNQEDYQTAHQAGCDYALFNIVTDDFSMMGSKPSTPLSPDMPGPVPLHAQQPPETSAIILFRLHRINPPALVGEGTIPVHAAAPMNVVIADGLNAAANQAFAKIAKDPQVPAKKP